MLSCEFSHLLGAEFGETWLGVQTGADGCSTHVDLIEEVHVSLKVENLFLKIGGVGMELLTGCHRDSVLKLCAAHLDHVLEFLAFYLERIDEFLEAFLQLPVHPDESVTEG